MKAVKRLSTNTKCLRTALAAMIISAAIGMVSADLRAQTVDESSLLDCVAKQAVSLASRKPYEHTVEVRSAEELINAVKAAKPSTLLRLTPGIYDMPQTLWVGVNNLGIEGMGAGCDSVELRGPGMENQAKKDQAPHGVWSNSPGLSLANLTISEYYYHGVILNADADQPYFNNVRILQTGQQQLKANPADFGSGVDDGRVIDSVIGYRVGPTMNDHGGGTGYTNGVDVHGGKRWSITGSLFANFHTPDNADHLWNPAILMWNGAADTIVSGNTFYRVDRAIAYGLLDRDRDHSGGEIVNNIVVNPPALFSQSRRADADAFVVVYSSPGTLVAHNSFLSNNSVALGIELRFDSRDSKVFNNLGDVSHRHRSALLAAGTWQEGNNIKIENATDWLGQIDSRPAIINASLTSNAFKVTRLAELGTDKLGAQRDQTTTSAGALAASSVASLVNNPSTEGTPAPVTPAEPDPDEPVSAPKSPKNFRLQVN